MPELSAVEVVKNLTALARQLQNLADELDVLEREAVEADEEATVANARSFLMEREGRWSVDARKQQAILDTADERLAAKIAEAKLRAHRNQINTLKVRIDVGRSAAALVRAEADMLGIGGRARGG